MELTEDEIIQKRCMHCNRNTILPYEYEFTCFSCGRNVIKREHELSKIQRKKINFFNRVKYAEQRIFCICVNVYILYEGNDCDKIYELLSTLKNKKSKVNNISLEN